MNGESTRKRVQAVLFAAIMVVSMVAAGIGGFAGSAAAEVSSVDGVSAENVTAGSASETQNVTLVGVNRTNSDTSNIEVEFFNAPNTSVVSASATDTGSFDGSNVTASKLSESNFSVQIDGNQTVTSNITVEVTLNTSDADTGTKSITVNPGELVSVSAEDSFEMLSADQAGSGTGGSSDEAIVVDAGDNKGDFSSIQAAVDSVDASGRTIVVRPGEYQGPVQVVDGQTNLTIRSTAGPENTVINATDGSARSTPGFDAQAVRISADGVTIDGFNIVGDDTIVSGVFVAGRDGGGDNVRVVNNIIEGMSRPGFGGPSDNSAGIVTSSAGYRDGDLSRDERVVNGFVARNNTIKNIGSTAKKPNNPDDGTRAQGISLIDIAGDTAGDGAVIKNNTISGLAGQDTTRGIAVQPLDRPVKNGPNLDPGVDVQDNDVSGADVGLSLGDSGALTIADNEFNDNRVSVEDSSEAVDLSTILQDNTFDRAVTIEDGTGSTTGNSIYGAIQPAVDSASSGNTVSVSGGIYMESVEISTGNLTLEGAGRDSTYIISDGENVGSQPHAAIHVDDGSGPVRDVTIEGFTVENPNGKYGIFAGTGSTNKDPDGIGGLVIRDNVVQNISTNSSGRALTGGPAGIGIRADYGTDGNPGIEISGNDISNVQNGDGPEPVGITLKSFTGEAGFGFDSNGDPVADTSSPPATDTDIVNNTISDINSTSGGYATKGISFSGEFEDVDVTNNSLTDIISPGSTAIAITFSENNKGDTPEDYKYDIDDDGNGERIGPRDFDVRNNEIGQVTAPDARAVNVGGYEQLGNHSVTQNNINDGAVVRYSGNQPGFDPTDADALKAQLNYWGDGQTPLAAGQVAYDPVLTTPAENVEGEFVAEIDEYGSVLELNNAGGARTLAIGFSAPPDANASEIFDDVGIEEGNAYTYESSGYEQISGSFTPETGEVIVFTTAEAIDRDIVVPIDTSVEGAAASPESVDVENGWNLVATGAADEIDGIPAALNGGSIEDATQLQAQPRQPGLAGEPAAVGAFDATWLFVNGNGEIVTGYSENQGPNLYSGEILYPDGQFPEAADIPDQTDESDERDDS